MACLSANDPKFPELDLFIDLHTTTLKGNVNYNVLNETRYLTVNPFCMLSKRSETFYFILIKIEALPIEGIFFCISHICRKDRPRLPVY